MRFIVWGAILCIFFYVFYQMIKYIHDKRVLDSVYERFQQVSEERQMNEEKLMQEQGNREKVGVLTRIDIRLMQSGVKKKFNFLTTELFIAIDLLFGLLGFLLLLELNKMPLFAAAGGVAVVIIPYIFMGVLSNKKAAMIEEDMNVFLDMMDAYSKSSDDIVDIIGKVYPLLNEPLNGYLEDFYFEAVRSGDLDGAFQHLKYKIPHKKLNEILGNLYICSRQLTDYSTIIKDSEEQLRTYLNGKRERQNARMDGAMELLIFAAVLAGSIYTASVITEVGLRELFTGSIIGQGMALYFICIGIAGLFVTFSHDNV